MSCVHKKIGIAICVCAAIALPGCAKSKPPTMDRAKLEAVINPPLTEEQKRAMPPKRKPTIVMAYVDGLDEFTLPQIKQSMASSNFRIASNKKDADYHIHISTYQPEFSNDGTEKDTLVYRRFEIENFAGAVLLMPSDATYNFDVERRKASVTYRLAYKIIDRNGKTVTKEATTNTLTRESITCGLPRIVNVFGGVQPANFWASKKMQQECTANRQIPTKASMIRAATETLGEYLRNVTVARSLKRN